MRRVWVEYDCVVCGKKAIYQETRDTDQPDAELLKLEHNSVSCTNVDCQVFDTPKWTKASRVHPAPSAVSPDFPALKSKQKAAGQ
jgi:hypothetical protein